MNGSDPNHSISRRNFLATALAVSAVPAIAQTPIFSTSVSVVNVYLTVRDKDGKIVRDLHKEAFTLEENDKPQQIRYFSQQSDVPLTLGLLVDISGSQRNLLDSQHTASVEFLRKALRDGTDRAFVVAFDREIDLVQQLTSSRKELETGLDKLVSIRDPNGKIPKRAQGTALYNAIFSSAHEIMSRQEGRKALIIVSDGVDTSSEKSLSNAIDDCQRADTLVYSIRFFDHQTYDYQLTPEQRGPASNLPDGRKILTRISRETGGGYFELYEEQTLDKSFDTIDEELHNQYSLGYTSSLKKKPGYRKIRVSVKQKGLTVRAREGYFSGG